MNKGVGPRPWALRFAVRSAAALSLIGSSAIGGTAHATEVDLPRDGPATATCPAYKPLGTSWMQGHFAPAPPSQNAFRDLMLEIHNKARQKVGVPNLEWDAQIATQAHAFAETLARRNRLVHSTFEERHRTGENLSGSGAGSEGAAVGELAEAWVREGPYYNGAVAPHTSCRAGISAGHYTQVVWRATKRLGCGVADANKVRVLVCRYDPPGNIEQHHPYKEAASKAR